MVASSPPVFHQWVPLRGLLDMAPPRPCGSSLGLSAAQQLVLVAAPGVLRQLVGGRSSRPLRTDAPEPLVCSLCGQRTGWNVVILSLVAEEDFWSQRIRQVVWSHPVFCALGVFCHLSSYRVMCGLRCSFLQQCGPEYRKGASRVLAVLCGGRFANIGSASLSLSQLSLLARRP